jgi:hypothetical protein
MFKVNTLTASLVAAGFLSVAGFAPTAKADTFNILQNACSSGLGCNGSTSVIATVTATTNGSNLDLVFHIVDSTFFFFQAGTPPSVAWNTNPAASATAASLTAMNGTPSGSTWANSGSATVGAPGTFNGSAGYTPNNNDVFQTDIKLTLAGATLASLLANASGFIFAADLCNGSTTTASCTSGKTGFAGAVGGTSQVPLPPAALLFGSALVGLTVLGRKRRKNGIAA